MKYAILISLLIFVGCSNTKQSNKLDKLEWLIGEWQQSADQHIITESWSRLNDTALYGFVLALDSVGDTAYTEHIHIILENYKLHYIPAVSNQNEAKPVRFSEIKLTDSSMVYENLKHDFPKRISYTLKNQSAIDVYIEGKVKGEMRRVNFPYVKLR